MRFCFQPNDVDKSLQESVLADQRVKLFSNIFAPFNSLGILGDRESEIEGCMKNWCFGRNAAIFLETTRTRHKVTMAFTCHSIFR